MKTMHIVSPSELRGVDVAPLDLVADWPSVPKAAADFHVVAVPLADVHTGDVPALCRYLKTSAERLILLDPIGQEEITLPTDARGCRIARSYHRSYEKSANLVSLPPIVEDPGPAADVPFAYETSFLVALATARETQVYNALRKWAPAMLRPRNGEGAARAAVKAYAMETTETLPNGQMRTRGTTFTPDQFLGGALAHEAAEQSRQARGFRADVRAFNDLWKPEPPTHEQQTYGAPPAPDRKEIRPLVTATFGARLVTGTGEVPPDELRASAARSRSLVAVPPLEGGGFPARAVMSAALARQCFLVGSAVAPFGIDVSDWCTFIPIDQADDAGQIIDAALRRQSDQEARARGRAARAWFDAVAKPSAWPQQLARCLS